MPTGSVAASCVVPESDGALLSLIREGEDGLAQLHLGSWEQGSRGFAERSRPTETIRYHISGWRPPWLNSADLTRRVSQSREVSRSTQPSQSPAPAPPGRRLSTTSILLSSNRFSRACARPKSGAMTAARQLAAILSIDIVAISRLTGEGSLGGRRVQSQRAAAEPPSATAACAAILAWRRSRRASLRAASDLVPLPARQVGSRVVQPLLNSHEARCARGPWSASTCPIRSRILSRSASAMARRS